MTDFLTNSYDLNSNDMGDSPSRSSELAKDTWNKFLELLSQNLKQAESQQFREINREVTGYFLRILIKLQRL